MARIKIVDLPKDMEISKEEMKKVSGGWSWSPYSTRTMLPLSPTVKYRPTGIVMSEEEEEVQL